MERFSTAARREIYQKLLSSIASLKRVVNAPDQRGKPDEINVSGYARIRTSDPESGHILSALFHQFLYGDKPVYKDQLTPKRGEEYESYNESVTSKDGYEISLAVPEKDLIQFIERIDDYIEKLNAPGKPEPGFGWPPTFRETTKGRKSPRSKS